MYYIFSQSSTVMAIRLKRPTIIRPRKPSEQIWKNIVTKNHIVHKVYISIEIIVMYLIGL